MVLSSLYPCYLNLTNPAVWAWRSFYYTLWFAQPKKYAIPKKETHKRRLCCFLSRFSLPLVLFLLNGFKIHPYSGKWSFSWRLVFWMLLRSVFRLVRLKAWLLLALKNEESMLTVTKDFSFFRVFLKNSWHVMSNMYLPQLLHLNSGQWVEDMKKENSYSCLFIYLPIFKWIWI